ncbi:hypothetical protein [Nonomuraea sp. JJY05]|uniref:hypothetical protein n=1 Tax=Nonomuraea sp. JJY05 TaxID=3350255 RepID=UPI00373F5978
MLLRLAYLTIASTFAAFAIATHERSGRGCRDSRSASRETLGHTSSAFTADTYTSVYPQVASAATEKTAALLFGEEDQDAPGKLISLRS